MKYIILLLALIIFISGCTQASLIPEQLLEDKDNFLDKEITVEGTAEADKLICTSLECPEEDPCCNTCSGNLVLKGEKEKISFDWKYNEKEVNCKGTECTQECYPLEKDKKYKVTGTWKKRSNEYYLEIKDFRLVE